MIAVEGGEVRFHKPTIYQPKSPAGSAGNSEFRIQNSEPVDGSYKLLAGNRVGFEIPSYDKSKPLVIDPTLSYEALVGGSGSDIGLALAVDSGGSAYLTGYTLSSDFLPLPATSPHLPSPNDALQGTEDAFVSKINAAGTALDYSTYLGGSSSEDQGLGIAVDSDGNAYVTGETTSLDFPTVGPPTVGPFQPASGGNRDAFVAKLNPTGDALIYSSYLGGSSDDIAYGIALALDSSGNAYVTGYTGSTDFPTTNPMQPSNAGQNDAFVTMISADGSTKVYSTYLGGTGSDIAHSVAVDSSGNAYITGATSSTDFPTTNPLQPANGGTGTNVFITKLNATGDTRVYSTYLGGTGGDNGEGIAVDSSGNAYVTGVAQSLNFPVAVNFLGLGPGGGWDVFVSKIDAAGANQVYTAILGGSNNDSGRGIALDSNGSVYVAGFSSSSDFPVASPLLGPNTAGNCSGAPCTDIVVLKINPAGNALIFSSYLGGDWTDFGFGIALNPSGSNNDAYVAGYSSSFNSGGPADAYVAKLSGLALPVVYLAPTRLDLGSVGVGFTSTPQTVTLENRGDALLLISSIAADGDFHVDPGSTLCSSSVAPGPSGICTIGVTVTPSTTGTLSGSLTITETDLTTHTVALSATGTPAPAVSLSTTFLSFPDQVVGTTSAVSDLTTVTLTNTGTAPLTISGITPTTGDFGVALPNTPGATACQLLIGTPMAVGASCRIPVVFMPTTTTGVLGGSLMIADNAPPAGSHSVSLSGRSLSAGAVSGLPASLPDFGNVLLDAASAPQTLTLTNTGSGPMQILDIYTTGYFYSTTTCPTSLDAGANCSISVFFIPYSAGSQTGGLVVATDADPGGIPTTVTLSGTGITDVVQLFPRNLLFGERLLNDTSPAKTITVTNTGSAAVALAPVATGDFALVPDATTPCGASLDPGASCTIDVTFTPTVDGRRDGTLTITTDAPDSPEVARLIGASAIRDVPGFEANVLTRNDDGSNGPYSVTFHCQLLRQLVLGPLRQQQRERYLRPAARGVHSVRSDQHQHGHHRAVLCGRRHAGHRFQRGHLRDGNGQRASRLWRELDQRRLLREPRRQAQQLPARVDRPFGHCARQLRFRDELRDD